MEKEKGKGNCVGMLGNKKSFVSLTYARRRSFQKTLRVTTSNYRLFLLVDHSDKIPETIWYTFRWISSLLTVRGRSGLLSISGFVCTAHRGLFFGMPAISHQPMVLCKGSPEKCCPAHCFFLIPFFFWTLCIIVSFFGLSSNFKKNIMFFPWK